MQSFSDRLTQLLDELMSSLRRLDHRQSILQLPPMEEREWYELLRRKLLPQLGKQPFLIAAVVGGTNIGKSVIFNHLAGDKISSTSPLASGTKHPTAILSHRLAQHARLEELFDGFEIEPFSDPRKPLQADSQHRLFYQVNERTPENLIILDTPDIDSVEVINWERADAIRQSADVLIAVLTQQKYNDAAIKEFFRKAAEEGKLVIVIFNQVLLPEDEEYWPVWMKTFCEETGLNPHLVFLAPNDRAAAESNRLPFYERFWPEGEQSPEAKNQPRQLVEELSHLKFDELKQQALSGALSFLVHSEQGIPSWLKEISDKSHEFREAMQLLAGGRLVEVDRWPTLPNSIFIDQIRSWWRKQRVGWSAGVHGFYQRVGDAIAVPFKLLRQRSSPPSESPIDRYRQQEWGAILEVVEHALQRLEWIRDLGNPLLTPRLEAILSGGAREQLLQHLRQAHQQIDFETEISQLVDQQMQQFRDERPDAYRLFRHVDTAAAAARPAISLALFMTGAGPLGDAIAPLVAQTALQSALHLAGDAIGGTVATAVGDKVITEAASSGAGYVEAKIRQFHTMFAKLRAEWIASQLDQHLLGAFSRDVRQAAEIPSSEEFHAISQAVNELRQVIKSGASSGF